MLGEDVEDQGGPVDDLDLDDVFEGDELAWAELTVADDGVRAALQHDVTQLAGLAGADEGGRVGLVAALDHTVEDEGTGGLGEGGELRQGVLRVVHGAGGPDADEHHSFQSQLAVLDFGDVFEFGREADDAAQGRALGALELVAVPVSVDRVAPGDVLFHQGVGPKALGEALRVRRVACVACVPRVLGRG